MFSKWLNLFFSNVGKMYEKAVFASYKSKGIIDLFIT